jgi:D-amino-acid dehydrogenase
MLPIRNMMRFSQQSSIIKRGIPYHCVGVLMHRAFNTWSFAASTKQHKINKLTTVLSKASSSTSGEDPPGLGLASRERQLPLRHTLPSRGPCNSNPTDVSLTAPTNLLGREHSIRIGIVGGGIAGVTAAHALAKRLPTTGCGYDIVVLEGDPAGGHGEERTKPPWTAALARNGNSMVPATSMHVFSRPSVVLKILGDTLRLWCLRQAENLPRVFRRAKQQGAMVVRSDDFEAQPPYFALHLDRCVGPSASPEERWSFVRFMFHFLHSSCFGAAEERGKQLCRLAQANRDMFLSEASERDFNQTKGFLSIHRDPNSAMEEIMEARANGEEADHMDWEQAMALEPHLRNFPSLKPLYAVHRPNDFTAGCEAFIRQWIAESIVMGVQYRNSKVHRLESIPAQISNEGKPESVIFRVTTEDGVSLEFDLLILAAGAETPLMAAQLGVGNYCPTYPLRGYSLTVFASQGSYGQDVQLLRKPFTLDAMYFSSIKRGMVRVAGFGELVGYRRETAEAVPPSLGPSVTARYANVLFPETGVAQEDDVLPCFRPMSPDDLPIVGEVSALPGLFLHTGHGTLGWTTGLTTGDCVAQAVVDKLEGRQEGSFDLQNNGTRMDRGILSPNRFVR